MTEEQEQQMWLAASTMLELGELAARWLEGDLSWQPCYYGDEPEPETAGLIGVLALANRGGFFTDQSQPGEIGDGYSQRAFVDGFADEATAERIRVAFSSTDLVVIAIPAHVDRTCALVPVTRDGVEEFTWLGTGVAIDDLRASYEGLVSPQALLGLMSAWQLHIFDPVWGRNDRLWPILEAVMTTPTTVEGGAET
jgi:hypothetical protein